MILQDTNHLTKIRTLDWLQTAEDFECEAQEV